MLSAQENELLVRVVDDAPMGQLMRRYWIPALLSTELPEPDGAPVQVRLLGEELVAYRDSEGNVGLLDEHCSHRGSSLVYARNEDCGLRCIYHGWKYDREGNVLDTPAEPERSVIKSKVRHPAYPTREVAGLIWTYLEPKDQEPLFPNYLFTTVPEANRQVSKMLLECNWLQGLEGECDSSHVSVLHRRFRPEELAKPLQLNQAPDYETEDTDFGVRLIATRAMPDPDTHYVRVSSFVMPFEVWVWPFNREIHFYVPIDDTRTWRYDLGFLERPVAEDDEVIRPPEMGPGFRKVQTMENRYLQDRQAQLTRDFSGIENVITQDAAMTETMDYSGIFDRTKEKLGMGDIGVIAVRDFLLRTVRAFADGGAPPHVITEPAKNDMSHIDTIQEVFSITETWREHWPHLSATGPAAGPAKR